ncbi:anhydro-N-acetylmuramic acid kinase [Sphingobacterium bovistauri]|uniref:Anhydro-N-acetylmuramic acid kinase n=1 Tax=Sphingobacterium bovistauri TaxID=2781959 RepID=A0ABS7Z8S5_9SPHI|nr:anhydro-N-acetylmuramic acid kinase [Sphingobacterium bovistauri]MCA5006600.1 anhydro-N-acetylmuramic acid kinase [Sphingobacterium bovistauri]
MNSQIAKLYEIGKKNNRLILGLMSGTSLDGLDIALCKISNSGIETKLELLKFDTLDYDDEFRIYIRRIFAKKDISQQDLSGINAYVGIIHANLINTALRKWEITANDIDLIASHGQTVYHAPQILTKDYTLPNSTLQIGDGDHIAVNTGIITISDFRQKHIAAGGEGAPLAAYGDYLLFTDRTQHRILLNIGGISNFTFLPNSSTELKSFATDLGPGNTIMNQYMKKYFDVEMDIDALVAQKGNVHQGLLIALLEEEFLSHNFPKTTGPELFNLAYLEDKQRASNSLNLSKEDVMATLNAFSAEAIVAGILKVSSNLENVGIYVSGGGLHNPLLMQNIQKGLPNMLVTSIDEIGVNPDAKEACLFAILANETVAGSPDNVNSIKDSPAVCMGKICLPN